MINLLKTFNDSFKTSSKKITSNKEGKYITTSENQSASFKEQLKKHFLGITRLGVSPEIQGQEDKVLFGAIDIDCKDTSIEEKYQMAQNLQRYAFDEYRLNLLIEKSKSKGFHLFLFFATPKKRDFIQKLLENIVTEVTAKKITNGVIEVFPKGKKGTAINLPLFGMYENNDIINADFFEDKNTCFVEDEGMKAITNPLQRIKNAMAVNGSILLLLESLSAYPACITKAALNWKDGDRNSLTLGISGVLKKIAKITLEEALEVVKDIAEFNRDEEISNRLAAVEATYKNDNVAGCSILKGESNLSPSVAICTKDCKQKSEVIPIKALVRRIQASKEYGGVYKKDKIAQLIISKISELGRIYKAENQYYLFLNEEKRLICLSNEPPELKTLFTKWGLNASETLYKFVLNELHVYCSENAKPVEINKYAYYDNKNFVLYLYNGPREILKITADTVLSIENGDDGILFMELKNFEPFELVDFEHTKDYILAYLTGNLNIDKDATILGTDEQKKIARLWIFSLFFESIMKTKPIFTVVGVKGSGKTTFIRRVGQILFGSKFDVTAVSNDCKDLDTIITNNYYVAIDNLDNPPKSLNDALARIATGQIIKKRKLFTTNEELEFTVKCFVSLTSRTPQFTRDDVADRLICIYLERYETFQGENNLRREAISKRNEIMCYIISEIQQMLKMLQTNNNEKYSIDFRMADFAIFGLKTAKNKEEAEELKRIFSSMVKVQNEFTLRDDTLYILLKECLKEQGFSNKRYSSAELYNLFRLKADEKGILRAFEAVYKNPKSISKRLRNIKDNISDEVLINIKKGHGNVIFCTFTPIDVIEEDDSLI